MTFVQVLQHRPGDGQPVEGGRAAPDLVEDHQAALRRLVEDCRRLGHLDHEGGAAARQVVGGADTGEEPVGHADMGGRGGHIEPACASTAKSAFCRRKVDLPAMFGP